MLPQDSESDEAEREESTIREVRFPLPQLMRELRLERTTSLFAKDILDQTEIFQIFATRRRKHARSAE
jgi:hypothetical protein